jgi:4-hydroxythreonine-4-phosphate dehydrogenase
MPATVAVVADDLTGAADAGAGFLRAGLSTIVAWSDSAIDRRLFEQADVIAIDARTRARDAAFASAATMAAVAEVFNAGVTVLYKKMDSLLRGHIGEEIHATLSAWHPGAIAIVAPAFPAMGRTTIDGRQRVRGVVLDRPAIHNILIDAGVPAAVADLAMVRGNRLTEEIESHRRAGVRAIACDADVDSDLSVIAKAGTELGRHVVWVGSGGLAHAVARHVAPLVTPHATAVVAPSPAVLTIVGSASDVSRDQIAHERSLGVQHVEVTSDRLVDGDVAYTKSIAARVESHLRQRQDVVVGFDQGDREDEQLTVRLAALLAPATAFAGGLILTGGDTATRMLDAIGARCLRLIEEVEPGLPLAVAIGERSLFVMTKPGAFGNATTLTHARERLKAALDVT